MSAAREIFGERDEVRHFERDMVESSRALVEALQRAPVRNHEFDRRATGGFGEDAKRVKGLDRAAVGFAEAEQRHQRLGGLFVGLHDADVMQRRVLEDHLASAELLADVGNEPVGQNARAVGGQMPVVGVPLRMAGEERGVDDVAELPIEGLFLNGVGAGVEGKVQEHDPRPLRARELSDLPDVMTLVAELDIPERGGQDRRPHALFKLADPPHQFVVRSRNRPGAVREELGAGRVDVGASVGRGVEGLGQAP